jgi:NitT/TauT family transport system ATP-binding protein
MTKAESKVESQPYTYRLPDVSVAELSGLLETMVGHETNDKINLSELAEDLHLDIDNVFPLTDALIILKFIKVEHSEFIFLAAGKQFAAAGILERKHLFARHLLKYVPLAHHIREVLDSEPHHRISENVLLEELQVSLNEEEAERLLKVIIDWGRYAEIFAYDYDSGILSLENPE